MIIQNMFYDNIDRKINGVVKVDQSTDDVLKQEVKEYVITKDIRRHMVTFFNNYGSSFEEPTADIGVWISGFFGSGKSHFLKMLSYLLENKEIDGRRVEDYFREKFQGPLAAIQKRYCSILILKVLLIKITRQFCACLPRCFITILDFMVRI